MPPGRSNGKEMGQRGLNGTEFLHRCQRVIECLNAQVFPRVPDLLFPYVHYHLYLIEKQIHNLYHKDMRKRIEGNEMMRKDLNLAAKMIQECHI